MGEEVSPESVYELAYLSLPSLLKQMGIERIAAMKLDCEGCEWTVARDWLLRRLRRPRYPVVGEIHTFCPYALWHDYVAIEKCVPDDMPLNTSEKIWRYLCKELVIDEDGCADPHFGAFHSPSKSFRDVARGYLLHKEREQLKRDPNYKIGQAGSLQ